MRSTEPKLKNSETNELAPTELGDCPKNSPRIRGLFPNSVAAVENLCIVRAGTC